MNDRIAHLRRKEKWNLLKKLRQRRHNYAIDKDRKTVKKIVEHVEKEIVVVGNSHNIRYHKYKGNWLTPNLHCSYVVMYFRSTM